MTIIRVIKNREGGFDVIFPGTDRRNIGSFATRDEAEARADWEAAR